MTDYVLGVDIGSGSVKLTNSKGFYTKLDLGIVKYHFEAVSKAAIL